jgi:hypothetical protein
MREPRLNSLESRTFIDVETLTQGQVFSITDTEQMNSMLSSYTTFSTNNIYPSTVEEVKAARAKAEEEKVHDEEDIEDKVRGGMGKV